MSIVYYLKNFNNYYNRVIKKYDSISDYLTVDEEGNTNYAVRGNDDLVKYENKGPVNFSINDGVTSSIPYNYDRAQTWEPDYVVVCDENNNITSRWFVIEARRSRKGQYALQLRRDLIADNYEGVINAPCFIEKATLQYTDPMLFNPENMTYNQIKSESEILLKDETQVPWIVGYVAAPQDEETDLIINAKYSHTIDYNVSGIGNWAQGLKGKSAFLDPNEQYLTFIVEGENVHTLSYKYTVNITGNSCDTAYEESNISATYRYREPSTASNTRTRLKNKVKSVSNIIDHIKATINTDYVYESDSTVAASIWALNNKLIYDSTTGLYYRSYVRSQSVSNTYTVNDTTPDLYTDMQTVASVFSSGRGTSKGFSYTKTYQLLELNVQLVDGNLNCHTTIKSNRRTLNDSPYCMFAIPADNLTVVTKSGSSFISDKTSSFALARAIAEKLTGAKCYDLQLVPYCPRQDLIIAENSISLQSSSVISDIDFSYVYFGDSSSTTTTDATILLWGTDSNFNISVPVNIQVPEESIELKVENETSFYRLCSPNYAGAYEFSVAKSYGINYVNIDCAYKPYTPYIHAYPEFKGLYGTATGDARGLICGGDFSLPQTSDAWASYELANKNYQNSFDRQISNLQFTHKYEMISSGLNAITGTLGAAGAAATQGAGAALAAGGASLIGGIADQYIAQDLFNENIDYTKDQFGYQLGNIKAQPDTLSKISAYNPNNKVFLFIEHYDSTKEEKQALRDKIKYNGMSVGRIGKISDYMQEEKTYIKGKIIRLEGTNSDYHEVNEIGLEISKGVFI